MKKFSTISKKAHVLVVDDDRAAQMLIRSYLQNMGHQVTTANNGLEAVKLANINNYDYITMDINMPKLDGINATIQIREQDQNRKAFPIIGITANVDKKILKACLDAGMNAVITKPAKMEKLKQLMSKFATHDICLSSSSKAA